LTGILVLSSRNNIVLKMDEIFLKIKKNIKPEVEALQ
jgi:hypothetical protein